MIKMSNNHKTNGIRLFNHIRNDENLKNLLIKEDFALLLNAFESQFELDSIESSRSEFDIDSLFSKKLLNFVINNCNIIYSLSAVIVLATLILSDSITQWMDLLIILFACLISFVILWLKRNQIGCNELSLIKLAEQINNERQSLTKLKELIEDNWNNNNNNVENNCLTRLAINFRDIGIRCAQDFRQQTLTLKELLPLKADIDDNLLSTIPENLYESYNNCDMDNIRTLKSLRQLIRLQISEFFKRILLVYVRNYHLNDENFMEKFSNQNFIEKFNEIIRKMMENSIGRQKELLKIISFHKSFYLPSTIRDNDDKNVDKMKNELKILWQNFRNIRKCLYRSINSIDDCEMIVDQCDNDDNVATTTTETSDLKMMKANFDCKLGSIAEQLTTAQDMIQTIRRSLQRNDNRQRINSEPITQNNDIDSNIDDNNRSGRKINLIQESEPPKDEVFEAFIDNNDNFQRSNVFNDYDQDDDDQMDNEMKIMENNMFNELRTALKDKHIEHRIREARAQGLNVNIEQIENDYYQQQQQQTIPKQLMFDDTNHDNSDGRIETIDSQQQQQSSSSPVMGLNLKFDFNLAMNDSNQLK
uniref:Protein PFC0760c-like n=1 Tax=Dermatophagoides pteronyssinus TaxID=6956 RepID=A0A6P6Y8I7_DERPT